MKQTCCDYQTDAWKTLQQNGGQIGYTVVVTIFVFYLLVDGEMCCAINQNL